MHQQLTSDGVTMLYLKKKKNFLIPWRPALFMSVYSRLKIIFIKKWTIPKGQFCKKLE